MSMPSSRPLAGLGQAPKSQAAARPMGISWHQPLYLKLTKAFGEPFDQAKV